MHFTFKLAAGLVAALSVAGCADSVRKQASYVAPMAGEFEEAGKFTGTFAFVADYDAGTFTGEIRDMEFTRPELATTRGVVPMSGTITETAPNEYAFQATGQGRLANGSRNYNLGIEMESSFIDEDRRRVTGWYFGGGEFNRGTTYVDWLTMRGQFEASLVCKTGLFNDTPCPMPPLSETAGLAPDINTVELPER
ncbi:MAG: hypothetical protein AAF771_13725 [Pseudomonadota bacterium]